MQYLPTGRMTVTSPAYAPAPVPAEISTANFSFLVPWFGVLYHLFPALSYLVTEDWKKVFYDCFGPEVIVADTFIIVVTLWHHIFGPRRNDTMKSVILHTFGLGLNVMSICMFAMFHSQRWHKEGQVLGVFALVTLLTFMWMQMGVTIEDHNGGVAFAGYTVAATAEGCQIVWPALARVLKKNFVAHENPVLWLKVSATIVSIGVSSCELWHMFKEVFWSSNIERRFMVLSTINIIGGCLQLVVRFIGPQWFADSIEKCANRCYEWMAEKLVQCKRLLCGGNEE